MQCIPLIMDHPEETIRFEFIKSNLFRVIHADGAFGGLTPRLGIFINFYSERPPIPKVLVHRVSETSGVLGEEIREKRESKTGIVRESEVGVCVDVEVAKSLVVWLQDKIHAIEDARRTMEDAKTITDPDEERVQ